MTDTLRKAAQDLFDECLASDFNEHWDSYKALRAALAQPEDVMVRFSRINQQMENAQTEQCDWVYDDDGFFATSCSHHFMPDLAVGHPDEWMTYCYGCGKPIQFIEGDGK